MMGSIRKSELKSKRIQCSWGQLESFTNWVKKRARRDPFLSARTLPTRPLLLQALHDRAILGDAHGRILALVFKRELIDYPSILVVPADARDLGIRRFGLESLLHRERKSTQIN